MLLKPRSGRFQTWNLILGIDRRVVLETLIKLATIGVNSVSGRQKLRLFRETSEEKPDAFVVSKRKETARDIDKEVSIHNTDEPCRNDVASTRFEFTSSHEYRGLLYSFNLRLFKVGALQNADVKK